MGGQSRRSIVSRDGRCVSFGATGRRSVRERPCSKVMDEQIATENEGEAHLACFHAEDVGIEQAEIRPFFEFRQADAFEHLSLHEQAESGQTVHLDPLALALLTVVSCESVHGFHFQKWLAETESMRCFSSPWFHAVGHRLNE